MADSIETLRKKYGLKANPNAPETSTGRAIDPKTMSPYDQLRQKYGLSENDPGASVTYSDESSRTSDAMGEMTDVGTFIPDLGMIWDEQDQAGEQPISTYRRREAVGRAFSESIKTEERLRELGFPVPPVGQEEQPSGIMRILQYPLNLLTQLQRGQFAVVGGIEGILEGDASQAVNNFYKGLFLAEEHSVQDILNRYEATRNMAPWEKFALGLAGDIALDPLTWITFGASGIARGAATAGVKTSKELIPHLSRFGKRVLKEAMETVSEETAVRALVEEIAHKTRIGKRAIPHGVRFVDWVPVVGGQRVVDPLTGLVENIMPRALAPGSIIQRIDDLVSTQGVMDKFTTALMGSKAFDWLGKAFVPYWEIRKKYPWLADLEIAYKNKKGSEVSKIIERGKQLVRTVPEEEDRKLLTELLDKPWLIDGKKLATVRKTEKGIPELKVNLDYFPEPNTIDPNDADELLDFFLKVRREMVNPEDLLLSTQGLMSQIAGGPKFEALRPFFQSLIATSPDAPVYQIKFDDFIIKIPVSSAFGNRGFGEFGAQAIGDMMGEAYIAEKLGGSGLAPEAKLMWRFGDEVMGFEPVNVTARIDELAPALQWAAVVGGHSRMQQLGMFPGDVQEFARQLVANGTVETANIPIPFIVKRFIKGAENISDAANRVMRTSPKGSPVEAARMFTAVHKLMKGLARVGIDAQDFHGGNVMLRGDTAIWVDTGHFVDHARGVVSPPHAVPGEFKVDYGDFNRRYPKTPTTRTVEMSERLGIGGGELVTAAPGMPYFAAKAPKIEMPTDAEEWAQYLREAGADAFSNMLDTNEANREFSALFGIPYYMLKNENQAIKFAQELKARGVITEYGKNVEGVNLGFDIKGRFDHSPSEPVTRIARAAVPERSWEEVSEVIVAKHPKFASLSADRQRAIMDGFKLAQSWKDELVRTIGKDKVLKADEGDLAVLLTSAAVDAAEDNNVQQFIGEVARTWGKPAATVVKMGKRGQHTVNGADPGWVLVPHESFKNIQIPEEVAKGITQYVKTFQRRDEIGSQFWNKYDDVLNWWKGYATVINPGFHARNFFSNIFNLWLKDGPEALNPFTHKHAAAIMSGKKGRIVLRSGEEVSYSQVLDWAETYGVYNKGWLGDLQTQMKVAEDLRPGNVNPFSRQFVGMKLGRKIGAGVENEARMVSFINDLVRTGNPQWSAQNTTKYLFDYSEITDFVKYGMKRAFPFFTWLQKNIALQASEIIRQPGKYGDIARLRSNLEAQSPSPDERWLPRYFPELYAMRTPFKTKEGSPLYWNPNLPFQDLNRIFDPNDWIASLAPWRVIFETAANYNFFTRKEIQKYKGEYVEAGWLNVLPDSVMDKLDFIGVKKVFEPESNRWFYGLPPKVKYAIEQAWPVARNWSKNIIDPMRQAAGEGSPEYQKESQPYNVMSWMAGVKMMPYNQGAEIEKGIFRRRDILRDQQRSLERRGKMPSYYLPDVEPKKRLPRSH